MRWELALAERLADPAAAAARDERNAEIERERLRKVQRDRERHRREAARRDRERVRELFPGKLALAAATELMRDPRRPNAAVADAAGCSKSAVQVVRERLEREGLLPRWRARHPGCPPTDAGLLARKLLHDEPHRTAREIAEMAGITPERVWQLRKRQREAGMSRLPA